MPKELELAELDAWLAEHVMGWPVCHDGDDCCGCDAQVIQSRGNWFVCDEKADPWHPTRDLNPAVGEVVPRVLERMGKGTDFSLFIPSMQHAYWVSEFTDQSGVVRDGIDPSPAVAVCLAAKAAWEAAK